MGHPYPVLLEWDAVDEVFVTYVPALNFLSTFGETRDEAIQNTREAILGYLEAAHLEGLEPREDVREAEIIEIAV